MWETPIETVAVTIDGMGINKNIEGKSFAGGTAIQILSPEETATGGSAFDTPLQINATGGSDTNISSFKCSQWFISLSNTNQKRVSQAHQLTRYCKMHQDLEHQLLTL